MAQQGWFWTKEDTDTALRLHGERMSYDDIGLQLNRTGNSIKNHLARLKAGPEKVAEYRLKGEINRRIKKREANAFDANRENDVTHRPTSPMIEAQQTLVRAPYRDLTGYLMGDPPFGYSALERRT